jgi:hypothetical protein
MRAKITTNETPLSPFPTNDSPHSFSKSIDINKEVTSIVVKGSGCVQGLLMSSNCRFAIMEFHVIQ